VRTYLSEPLPLETSRGGFVERIDHLGVASADNSAAVEAFATRLGCAIESTHALIGFIHPKSVSGVLMHLVQREEI
jgi:hypothetical protein